MAVDDAAPIKSRSPTTAQKHRTPDHHACPLRAQYHGAARDRRLRHPNQTQRPNPAVDKARPIESQSGRFPERPKAEYTTWMPVGYRSITLHMKLFPWAARFSYASSIARVTTPAAYTVYLTRFDFGRNPQIRQTPKCPISQNIPTPKTAELGESFPLAPNAIPTVLKMQNPAPRVEAWARTRDRHAPNTGTRPPNSGQVPPAPASKSGPISHSSPRA